MEFSELQLTNFRSFSGTHSFSFADRQPGLYFLTGRNNVEPRLGSNGAGKSSILDGLCWALYGKTTRGLRGPQVCNWAAEKGCEAAVTLDGVTVRRGWNPNFLSVSDAQGRVDVTQEELERDVLPLSYSSFLYAVILGQFGSFFFDLTPANKMAVLSDVLDIDYWTECSKQARSKSEELKQQYSRVESRIRASQENEVIWRNEIESYRKKSVEFLRNREHNVKVQRDYVRDLRKQLAVCQNDIRHISRDWTALQRRRSERLRYKNEARADYNQIRERVRELESEKRVVQQEDEHYQHTLEKFSAVEDVCPYCYQKVDAEHIKREKNNVKRERSQLFAQMAKLQQQIISAKAHLKDAEQRHENARSEIEDIDERMGGAEQTYNKRARERERLRANLETAEAELEREQNREDVYTGEWRRYRQSLAEKLRQRRSLQRELRGIENELAKAQYWVDGFKSVRLFLVEECIKFLEVETNNALTNLGLLDWRVRFDLQRETKEGAISKGFSVMIYSPSNAKEVPWEAWAGGETQRLRLAGALALSGLILNAKGTGSNILMVDEPSAHLDVDGMADTLDALQNYAIHTSKQCWLIDHRSYHYGSFVDQLVVEKDVDEGSAIRKLESATA